MSYSDLSFSSPRKGAVSDKSLDEDFEKFLVDSSFSELSTKNKTKKNEPWWMSNESKNTTFNTSKSFMKQPKPIQRQPSPKESYELNMSNKKSTLVDSYSKSKSFEKVIEYDEPLDEMIKKSNNSSQPQASYESTYTSFDRDEVDNLIKAEIAKHKSDLNSILSDDKSVSHHEEEKIIKKKSTETMDSTKGNLLSRVLLLDTQDSAFNKSSGQTLKPIDSSTIKKVQISEDLVQYEPKQDHNQSQLEITIDPNNATAKSELEEIEEYYRKNLSTIEVTSLATDQTLPTKNTFFQNKVDLAANLIENIVNELEERTYNEVVSHFESPFNSRKFKSATLTNKKGPLRKNNTNKYRHVKSSGYGKHQPFTSTKESDFISSFEHKIPVTNASTKTTTLTMKLEDIDEEKVALNNKISSLIRERDDFRDMVIDLKNELRAKLKESELKIKELREGHENELQKLQERIEHEKKALPELQQEERIVQPKPIDLTEQEKLIQSYQIENEKLYNELKALKSQNPNNSNDTKEIQKLKLENQKLSFELDNKNSEINNLEKQIIKLKDEKTKLNTIKTDDTPKARLSSPLRQTTQVDEVYYLKSEKTMQEFFYLLEQKENEIKKLNEKLNFYDKNPKFTTDYVKKLKELERQAKQFELVAKRLKNSNGNSVALLSIEYFESQIKNLQSIVNEKSKEFELRERILRQRYDLIKHIYDKSKDSSIDFVVEELRGKLLSKVEMLSNENLNLKLEIDQVRNENKSLMSRLIELKNEIEQKTTDLNALKVKNEQINTIQAPKRDYEPKQFKDDDDSLRIKQLQDDNTYLKGQNDKLKSELNAKIKEHEAILKELNEEYSQKIKKLSEAHRVEIENLVKTLDNLKETNNIESLELLENSRLHIIKLNSIIEEQKALISNLSIKYGNYDELKDKVHQFESENRQLNEQLINLKEDLSMLKQYKTPQMAHFEKLKEKLTNIEMNNHRREQEIHHLMNKNLNKSLNNVDHIGINDKNSVHFKRLLDEKDEQIMRFRLELDQMLRLIESLKPIYNFK